LVPRKVTYISHLDRTHEVKRPGTVRVFGRDRQLP
jgi:hypothetical protein